MIHHFEPAHTRESAAGNRFQWQAAIGAGFCAGIILVVVPRGSPWSGLTFFAPTIMGRWVPAAWHFSGLESFCIHMALSLIYGIIVSLAVRNIHELRAVLAGGIVGLALYLMNVAVVSVVAPALRGPEFPVVLAHIFFGLIAGGAYRGLLRRRDRKPGMEATWK